MKRFIISAFLTVCFVCCVHAQPGARCTVNGYLRDAHTTESLVGATVSNPATHAGTTANQYGFYSITLPVGETSLQYSLVGYAPVIITFRLRTDTVINVNLSGSLQLGEIIIDADRTAPIQEQTQMSVIRLPISQVKSLPAFLGETDLLKTLQLMPGVQSGGEGGTGLYVRGGSPDQNLFLLDGVPLYNVSHLFGFFSIFNADAINSVELYKGGFPARYGGRVSSVVDVTLKEGNMQKFCGEGAIGFISSKLTLEGPIWKNKTSFIISGRRTFLDLIALPVLAMINPNNQINYYFYDLNAKINHRFSKNDRIFMSVYTGADVYSQFNESRSDDDYNQQHFKYRSDLKWENLTASTRWNHLYGAKLFSNATLYYNRYRNISFKESSSDWLLLNPFVDPADTLASGKNYQALEYLSRVSDIGGRIAFDYHLSPDHHIRFGGNASLHDYTPGATSSQQDTIKEHSTVKIRGAEYNLYAEDDIIFTNRLKMNIGLHWSGFSVDGRFYQSLQPRISARYLLTDQLSVKAAYSRIAQYVHLLANSNIGLQMDLWVPSTVILRPQTSHQAMIGLAKNFNNNYEITLEGYYKTMDGVVEFRNGINFLNPNETWQEKVVQGKGRSYGMELFAQKQTGNFTGWVGYTLSWSDRKFNEINNGNRFFYKYDCRHDVSLALIKKISSKFEFSATWVLGSGTRTTLPLAVYQMINPLELSNCRADNCSYYVFDEEYADYDVRNNYRLNSYHRLDLSASLIKKKKWGERRWVFSIYNAYYRRNPFYIDVMFDHKHVKNFTTETYDLFWRYKFVQYNLFPIIPSISYQFKF